MFDEFVDEREWHKAGAAMFYAQAISVLPDHYTDEAAQPRTDDQSVPAHNNISLLWRFLLGFWRSVFLFYWGWCRWHSRWVLCP